MLRRFRNPTGSFRASTAKLARGAGGEFVDRPVLMVYDGGFESMDGHVDILPEHIIKLAETHNAKLAAQGVTDGLWAPMSFPPVQLDHNTSATVTVGRLNGPVAVETIEIDGVAHVCLTGVVRMLGRENVEKSEDGRFTHVSIGADLEAGIIKELTITPFPAAAEAKLLSEGAPMDPKKLAKYLKRTKKFATDKEAEEQLSNMSEDQKKELWGSLEAEQKRFAEHFAGAGLSEKETADKMSRMTDEETEKLWGTLEARRLADEDAKKLAAEHEELKKKLAEKDADGDHDGDKKMAAKRAKVTELFAATDKKAAETRLAALKSNINVRLANLQGQGKITPAERKKINVEELAAKGNTIVEEKLSSYADREPVIHMGQIGSVTALAVGAISASDAKKIKVAQLEEESRARMHMKPNEENVKFLKGVPRGVRLEGGQEDAAGYGDASHMSHLEEHLGNIEKCAKDGNLKDLMKHLDGLRKSLSSMAFPPMDAGAEKQMSALIKQVDDLQTELTAMKSKVLELIA